jgi:hypothetical protein
MLIRMTDLGRGNPRRRAWLTVMIVIACARVFAAVPSIEAHEPGVESVFEHGHPLAQEAEGDSIQPHFHCHNGCAHAPMLAPSTAQIVTPASSASMPFMARSPSPPPTFTPFRPPIA